VSPFPVGPTGIVAETIDGMLAGGTSKGSCLDTATALPDQSGMTRNAATTRERADIITDRQSFMKYGPSLATLNLLDLLRFEQPRAHTVVET
jgi:hypothetical protein